MNVTHRGSDVERNTRISLFITFISLGIGLWFVSESIGMGCFILTVLWGILFVFHKSPVRKWCWSVSDKLSIAIVYYGGHPPGGNRNYLTVYGELRALLPIEVDKVVIIIGIKKKKIIPWRKKIISWDWRPHVVSGDEGGYVDFKRPEWLSDGNHDARLIACTPYGYSKSEEFAIRVRD